MQLFCAGRIGEIAGIQIKNINLIKKQLKIKEVIVWVNGKPHIKSYPKNGEIRIVHINKTLEDIFLKHMSLKKENCPFLFHRDGEAFRYNAINEAYLRAWKKSGLYPKFSGSHQIRYSGAQLARKICGSLDAAMAVTGHKSSRMAEKYSHSFNHELNKEASLKMQDFLINN